VKLLSALVVMVGSAVFLSISFLRSVSAVMPESELSLIVGLRGPAYVFLLLLEASFTFV